MNSPVNLIYEAIFRAIKEAGYPVYSYLPQEKEHVTYPFVVLSRTSQTPFETKNTWLGRVQADIDVWGEAKKRNQVANIMDHIMLLCANLPLERVVLDVNESNSEIVLDQSTAVSLWRGRLFVTLHF